MVTCGLLTNHRHGNHILMYDPDYIFLLFLKHFSWFPSTDKPEHQWCRSSCYIQRIALSDSIYPMHAHI